MDAAVRRPEGRTMHGVIVENRRVRVVHDDRLGWRTSTKLTTQSREKSIFEGALGLHGEN
jgi:hypothetical protein